MGMGSKVDYINYKYIIGSTMLNLNLNINLRNSHGHHIRSNPETAARWRAAVNGF